MSVSAPIGWKQHFHLLRIEEQLEDSAKYPGLKAFYNIKK